MSKLVALNYNNTQSYPQLLGISFRQKKAHAIKRGFNLGIYMINFLTDGK